MNNIMYHTNIMIVIRKYCRRRNTFRSFSFIINRTIINTISIVMHHLTHRLKFSSQHINIIISQFTNCVNSHLMKFLTTSFTNHK